MHYPSGRTIRYGYDAMGRVNYVDLMRTASSAAEPIVSGTAFLPFGSLQTIYNGNNLRWDTSWDQSYRMSSLVLMPNDGTGANLIDRALRYYDGLNLQELNNSNLDASQTQQFDYDDASRCNRPTVPTQPVLVYDNREPAVGVQAGRQRQRHRELRLRLEHQPAVVHREGRTVQRTFTHDAAGNVTGDTPLGHGLRVHDQQCRRISQVKVGSSVKANYSYDGRNRLSIRQTLNATPSGTQHLIHDAWDHVIVETNGAGSGGAGVCLARRSCRWRCWTARRRPRTRRCCGAHRPSRPPGADDRCRTGGEVAGGVRAVRTVSTITGPAALQMRFPGQWFQLEAGLAYNWNRHYDSTTGRYTQPIHSGRRRIKRLWICWATTTCIY